MASFVAPITLQSAMLVFKLLTGAVKLSVGATVSTVNDAVFCVPVLPSLSATFTVMVCEPSDSADCGV